MKGVGTSLGLLAVGAAGLGAAVMAAAAAGSDPNALVRQGMNKFRQVGAECGNGNSAELCRGLLL